LSPVDGFELSTDRARIPVEVVHAWLAEHSYCSAHIPLDTLRRAIDGSLPFAVYEAVPDGRLVAFARVVTDFATFAYVADVFVLPPWRGRGLSKWLLEAMAEHPELEGLRRWALITRDAHGLYAQAGWQPLEAPERWMERRPLRAYPPPAPASDPPPR
jgi:GNAT superfamily N-acetyltransferase